MALEQHPRVALIGAGLIGGSLGLALRDTGSPVTAVFDAEPGRTVAAVAAGAGERAAASIVDAVRDCDLVVVAAPVSSIAEIVLEAAAALSQGSVITDVGSVKAPLVSAVEARMPAGVHFVGGHPMAGSEQSGIDAASADLFENASWALTPTKRTDPDAVASVSRLVRRVGATPILLPPNVHDEVVATVSHLPHVVASALMNVAARHGENVPPVLALAAGGFRDVTRIAAGSPHVWEDILAENESAVRDVLDEYIVELERFRASLADRPSVNELLSSAQAARRTLPRHVTDEEVWTIAVAVSDRPGEFAELTTAVGEAGVNVVDMQLRHSPEGGRGVLYLSVSGERAATQAQAVLRGLGHHAHSERVVP